MTRGQYQLQIPSISSPRTAHDQPRNLRCLRIVVRRGQALIDRAWQPYNGLRPSSTSERRSFPARQHATPDLTLTGRILRPGLQASTPRTYSRRW